MKNIRITIAYDGTKYKGWQRQKSIENTIQGKIEKVLSRMTETDVKITGAGRTDAGVHATGQIANFLIDKKYEIEQIQSYLNEFLPEDIRIVKIKEAGSRFHARYNTRSKTYKYRIYNSRYNNVFERQYSWHVQDKLDIKLMQEAAQLFVGKHDFSSVTSAKSKTKSMVRTIFNINIQTQLYPLIEITFIGNGFLHNMVRIITGTIVEVGLGERDIESIHDMLLKKERRFSGQKAPAKGLFLENIKY